MHRRVCAVGEKRARPATPKKKPPAKKAKAEAKLKSPAKSRAKGNKDGKEENKWETLKHNCVLFPPEYTPHGVKVKYDGVPVDLTPEQEEVATMYASMLQTHYIQVCRHDAFLGV